MVVCGDQRLSRASRSNERSKEQPIRVTNGPVGPVGEAVAPQTSALATSLLADGEIVHLRLKPSLWFVLLVSAPVITFGAVLILVGNLPVMAGAAASFVKAGTLVIGLRLVWALLQWFGRVYILTDRRVIRQRGVLNIQVFECRLDRLQNTFIRRTLVQRILGIGTIFFATAGSGQIESMWQHIAHPARVHKQIIEAITRHCRRNGTAPL
ncbi:MAG: PH domain-containing protein [Anaerolineaceae bacterium]|nr:PH domain-containing protein [Anaerolineaceae bacterium]